MPRDLDTSYTDEIVCPHCGAEVINEDEKRDVDDGLFNEQETEHTCRHCNNAFKVGLADYEFKYNTSKEV